MKYLVIIFLVLFNYNVVAQIKIDGPPVNPNPFADPAPRVEFKGIFLVLLKL